MSTPASRSGARPVGAQGLPWSRATAVGPSPRLLPQTPASPRSSRRPGRPAWPGAGPGRPPGFSAGRLSPGKSGLSPGASPLCARSCQIREFPGLKKEIFINNLNNNTVGWRVTPGKHTGGKKGSHGLAAVPGSWRGRSCCEKRPSRAGSVQGQRGRALYTGLEKEPRSRSGCGVQSEVSSFTSEGSQDSSGPCWEPGIFCYFLLLP